MFTKFAFITKGKFFTWTKDNYQKSLKNRFGFCNLIKANLLIKQFVQYDK